MAIPYRLRAAVNGVLARFGYKLIKRMDAASGGPVNVFDLAVRVATAEAGASFFFLQIGAYDGVAEDPIRHYIKRYHWRGLLVEPQPGPYDQLRATYQGEPQLLFENAAITERDGPVTLYVGDMNLMASVNRATAVSRSRRSARELTVRGMSLPSLMEKHNVSHVHLLQIDTEGYDFELLKQAFAVGLLPEVVRFEHTHLTKADRCAAVALLASGGYRLWQDGIDTVGVLQDAV